MNETIQKNIFEPIWPGEYRDLIKGVIKKSIYDKDFDSIIYNAEEISTETVFVKLRFASEGFERLAQQEIESGDPDSIAEFYKLMAIEYKNLSNDCILSLNQNTSVTINNYTETILLNIKTLELAPEKKTSKESVEYNATNNIDFGRQKRCNIELILKDENGTRFKFKPDEETLKFHLQAALKEKIDKSAKLLYAEFIENTVNTYSVAYHIINEAGKTIIQTGQ